MLPNSVPSSMAALLQQAQQRQQQQNAAAAAMMANNTSQNNSGTPALPSALEEEVGRRKAVMAGTPYSITKQFPWRLHEMLDLVEEEGLEEIVSFLPDGRSFKVHDPSRFEKGLMRRCFNQTKYKSFQRQLNLWGFERKNDPVFNIKGTYSHPWFIRGRKDLTPLIVRVGGAGNKFKNESLTENEKLRADAAVASSSQQQAFTPKHNSEKVKNEKGGAKGDLAEAAESLALIQKSGSVTSSPPKVDMKADQLIESKMPGKMNMSSLYSNLLKKDPSAPALSAGSFLNTFQSRPTFKLPGASPPGLKSSGDDSNPLSSVISALNRAEAIGSLTSNRAADSSNSGVAGPNTTGVANAGTSDELFRRLQEQQRASAASRTALIEEAMRISAERTTTAPNAGRNVDGQLSSTLGAANPASSQQELLQQYLAQQQQQNPNAAIQELANQRVAQLLAGSGASGSANNSTLNGSLGLHSIDALRNATGSAGGSNNNMMMEKMRLEEGIQALMKERLRLEAAAILQEREQRRRLEYLAAMQM